MADTIWQHLHGAAVVNVLGPGLVFLGFGALSMNPPAVKFAIGCFSVGYLVIIMKVGWWVAFQRHEPDWQKGIFVTALFAASGLLWFMSCTFAKSMAKPTEQQPSLAQTHKADATSPSPLGLTDDQKRAILLEVIQEYKATHPDWNNASKPNVTTSLDAEAWINNRIREKGYDFGVVLPRVVVQVPNHQKGIVMEDSHDNTFENTTAEGLGTAIDMKRSSHNKFKKTKITGTTTPEQK